MGGKNENQCELYKLFIVNLFCLQENIHECDEEQLGISDILIFSG